MGPRLPGRAAPDSPVAAGAGRAGGGGVAPGGSRSGGGRRRRGSIVDDQPSLHLGGQTIDNGPTIFSVRLLTIVLLLTMFCFRRHYGIRPGDKSLTHRVANLYAVTVDSYPACSPYMFHTCQQGAKTVPKGCVSRHFAVKLFQPR
jgi:hypothetical protein